MFSSQDMTDQEMIQETMELLKDDKNRPAYFVITNKEGASTVFLPCEEFDDNSAGSALCLFLVEAVKCLEQGRMEDLIVSYLTARRVLEEEGKKLRELEQQNTKEMVG